jgi:predicted O-methyltransferase YrrM
MPVFKERWEQIPGWFNWSDLYDKFVAEAEGITKVVEIGVWQGRSTAYLAHLIEQSGKPIFFYAFDTFEGSPEHNADIDAMKQRGTSLENIARQNLIDCGVADHVRILKQASVEGAKRFENGTLDLVFIDGDHGHEAVKADILAWLPKLKPGGLIAGDDYSPHWPGVVQAVDELLPERQVPLWWECRV